MTHTEALTLIAKISPSVHMHGTGQHQCTTCAVIIDMAREALGMGPVGTWAPPVTLEKTRPGVP